MVFKVLDQSEFVNGISCFKENNRRVGLREDEHPYNLLSKRYFVFI
jgi:hypothetical protein